MIRTTRISKGAPTFFFLSPLLPRQSLLVFRQPMIGGEIWGSEALSHSGMGRSRPGSRRLDVSNRPSARGLSVLYTVKATRPYNIAEAPTLQLFYYARVWPVPVCARTMYVKRSPSTVAVWAAVTNSFGGFWWCHVIGAHTLCIDCFPPLSSTLCYWHDELFVCTDQK